MGLGLSLGQRWEEQPGQNGDDGNDHQQFDEGKTGVNFWRFHDQKKRLGGKLMPLKTGCQPLRVSYFC